MGCASFVAVWKENAGDFRTGAAPVVAAHWVLSYWRGGYRELRFSRAGEQLQTERYAILGFTVSWKYATCTTSPPRSWNEVNIFNHHIQATPYRL